MPSLSLELWTQQSVECSDMPERMPCLFLHHFLCGGTGLALCCMLKCDYNDGIHIYRLFPCLLSMVCKMVRIRSDTNELLIGTKRAHQQNPRCTQIAHVCLLFIHASMSDFKSPPCYFHWWTPKMEMSLQKEKFIGGFPVTECKALWVPLLFSGLFLCRRAFGTE